MAFGHGSGSSLAQSFITHRTQLVATARSIVRCARRAEDVVQDAFVKILELSSEGEVRQPVGYLFSVVRNLAIDHYRRAAFECGLFVGEECGWGCPALEDGVETSLWTMQCRHLINEALAGLPARTRVAFDLHYRHDLTQREVAKRLSISPTLVNFLLRDAIEQCQRRLLSTADESRTWPRASYTKGRAETKTARDAVPA